MNALFNFRLEHLGQTFGWEPLPKARVNDLEISPDKITMGQGEYIVFHKLPNGEKKELSQEIFEIAYKILTQYSPAAIMNSGSEKAKEECAQRYESIKVKLKEIDPTLEAAFVPRTLYELIFIRKCIREDLKHKEICPYLNGSNPKNASITQKERKCWHLRSFSNLPGAADNENVQVKDVAYRLNKAMIKAFNPSNEGFTHLEFSAFAEKEIEFLKNHHENGLKTIEGLSDHYAHARLGELGPTINFGSVPIWRGPVRLWASVTPMGIRNETDAQIIRNAIALDCSKIAQSSFLLYRGADFQKDSISCKNTEREYYLLSYGTSIFAGCVYDGDATAFYYMRNERNAYAVTVPFDHLNDSPFDIYPTNTVAQLLGSGEDFHIKTKIWKDYKYPEFLEISSLRRLKSNQTKDELTDQFQHYKSKAIHLK